MPASTVFGYSVSGGTGSKWRHYSGQFTTTVKDSLDTWGQFTAFTTHPTWDGDNIVYNLSYAGPHLCVQSGRFTTTQKSSTDINAVDGTFVGLSTDSVGSSSNAIVAGASADKLYLLNGQSSNSVTDSVDISAVEETPSGCEYDGTNMVVGGKGPTGIYRKNYLFSGLFTATLKTSILRESIDADANDVSADMRNTLVTPFCGTADEKMYAGSGQFSNTLKDSQGTPTSLDNYINHGDVYERLDVDISLTPTALDVTSYGTHAVAVDLVYLDLGASDLTGGANWTKDLLLVAPSDTTLDSVIANQAATEDDYAFTEANTPWSNGTTVAIVPVNVGDTEVTIDVDLARVNSGGTVQSGPTSSDGGTQTASAGVKTFDFSGLSLGTWASTDRLRMRILHTNASKHGPEETITYDIGQAGVRIGGSAITVFADALDSTGWTTATVHSADITGGGITKSPTVLNAEPTYGTHTASILDNNHTALNSTAYGTHAAGLSVSPTALDASPTYGTHATSILDTATALDVTSYGTHAAQIQDTATALDVTSYGTHAVVYIQDATALDAGPTFGTHAAQLQVSPTALDASPTYGTHEAVTSYQADPTALDASPTLGTHITLLQSPATALDVTTYGTHAIQLRADATALDASPTLGTHAAQIQDTATALDASPTLGTHAASILDTATALDVTSYGTHWMIFHAVALDVTSYGTHEAGLSLSPTALDAGPILGTHAAQLQTSATALDAMSYGTHEVQLQTSATALDAMSYGTHTAQLQADATALDAMSYGTHWMIFHAVALDVTSYGTHDAFLAQFATALDASPSFGTHNMVYHAVALDAGPTFPVHSAVVVGGGIDNDRDFTIFPPQERRQSLGFLPQGGD